MLSMFNFYLYISGGKIKDALVHCRSSSVGPAEAEKMPKIVYVHFLLLGRNLLS